MNGQGGKITIEVNRQHYQLLETNNLPQAGQVSWEYSIKTIFRSVEHHRQISKHMRLNAVPS
jgi:hypothetical protein